jgi:hypothetical protein
VAANTHLNFVILAILPNFPLFIKQFLTKQAPQNTLFLAWASSFKKKP